ncbi:MAG TPA: glycosyl hydrolase [Pseudonocardiaceae bacterium]|jgi:hypothetical protein|nr:glycosyl hydrolase [Pseudonocardiaceae bacterium]
MGQEHDRVSTGIGSSVTRRRMLGISAAAVAGTLLPWGQLASANPLLGAAPQSGARWRGPSAFTTPPASVAPKFRWWWPNAQVDPGEIANEVNAVADAGFGGLEVSDVHHSGLIQLDTEHYGWGSAHWVDALDTALTTAARRGLTLDLTMGPSWPAAVPTITPDSAAASCELAHGVVTVAGSSTYSGPVPASALVPDAAVTKQTLFAVQVARTTGPAVSGITPLDQTSLVDVTATVQNGQITWTAPTSDTWVLISYWLRGSAQQPEAGPFTTPTAYVVDHFSQLGTQAVTDFWDRDILNPRIRLLLEVAGGAFFEDSLEIETNSTIWTPNLPTVFRQKTGYDLAPYLPILVELKGKFQFSYNSELNNHVRDDVNLTLSDLYRDNHLLALQSWANRLGMELRVQPYGLQTDSLDFSALLDIPEGESLGFKNLDDYRVMCGGRDLAGHQKLSCESICFANEAYSVLWHNALITIDSFYAGGVNQTVIHGFPYADAAGATWPGFAAFSPYNETGIGYCEAWGPRQPTWQHMPDIGRYLARTQLVLQTGTPKYDLLFYRQKGYTATGIGAPWSTASGIPIGWTHSFATDAVLSLPGVNVKKGVLAPDGPAFKAIILGPDQFDGNEYAISIEGAKLLLGFARAGLPVILIGDWSGVVSTGHVSAAEDAAVNSTIKELLTQRTALAVADQTGVPTALAQLGVRQSVQYNTSNLMTVRRIDGETDFYYLANSQHQVKTVLVPINQTASLTATSPAAVPYRLNAWTGEISRIAEFTRSAGKIDVQVVLNPGESTIVVLAAPGWAAGSGSTQVVSTSADSVRLSGQDVVLRSTTAGTYTATLSSGKSLRASISTVPAPITPPSWTLRAEDWQPKPGGTASETIKPVVTVELDTLVPWTSIPQLIDSSGIGHYTTTVTLPSSWRSVSGAVLDLGSVTDTFRVWVNGHLVPPAGPLTSKLDLGDLLKPGNNTIQVDVATTLLNRLRTVTPAIYGIATRQNYGLVGPVRIEPYQEATAR